MRKNEIPVWTPQKKVTRFVDFSFHAKERVAQRFGQEFSFQDLEEMASQIQEGQAEFLGQSRLGMGIYAVRHKGTEYPVYYSKRQKCIASVLPAEELVEAREKRDSINLKPSPKNEEEECNRLLLNYRGSLKNTLITSFFDERSQLIDDLPEVMKYEKQIVKRIRANKVPKIKDISKSLQLYKLKFDDGDSLWVVYMCKKSMIFGIMSESEAQELLSRLKSIDKLCPSKDALLAWDQERRQARERKMEIKRAKFEAKLLQFNVPVTEL